MTKWNQYFYNIAYAAARTSSCLSRQIGAVIARDNRVVSIGMNGPPSGIAHCEGPICPRHRAGYLSGEGLEHCPATHAEVNAVVNAARAGVSTVGTTMYMTCPIPCKDCMAVLINAGIERLVVSDFTLYDALSERLLVESGMHVEDFKGRIYIPSCQLLT